MQRSICITSYLLHGLSHTVRMLLKRVLHGVAILRASGATFNALLRNELERGELGPALLTEASPTESVTHSCISFVFETNLSTGPYATARN